MKTNNPLVNSHVGPYPNTSMGNFARTRYTAMTTDRNDPNSKRTPRTIMNRPFGLEPYL